MMGSTRGARQFNPGDPPSDPAELGRWLRELVVQLQATLTTLDEKTYTLRAVAPTKVWDGLTVYANGATFNPGLGKGLYMHNGSVYTLIKAIP